jgi:hypothetical protein
VALNDPEEVDDTNKTDFSKEEDFVPEESPPQPEPET